MLEPYQALSCLLLYFGPRVQFSEHKWCKVLDMLNMLNGKIQWMPKWLVILASFTELQFWDR